MATVSKILDSVQTNLKLSGGVLASVNTTLQIVNGIGDTVAEAIERALNGDTSTLGTALAEINSSNATLNEAIVTLGRVKDVILQSLPSVASPEIPTPPGEVLPPTLPIENITFPEIDIPSVEILPTSDTIGLPGSVSIYAESKF